MGQRVTSLASDSEERPQQISSGSVGCQEASVAGWSAQWGPDQNGAGRDSPCSVPTLSPGGVGALDQTWSVGLGNSGWAWRPSGLKDFSSLLSFVPSWSLLPGDHSLAALRLISRCCLPQLEALSFPLTFIEHLLDVHEALSQMPLTQPFQNPVSYTALTSFPKRNIEFCK